jgi:signal transduction histidine kinase
VNVRVPRALPRLRPLSIAVLLVVTALAVAGCLVTRQVVADQEHKLLKQRTEEAGLYLSSALGAVEGTLGSLATAAVGPGGPSAFMTSASLAAKVPNSFSTIALVSLAGTPTVVASGGIPIADLGSTRLAVVQQAVAAEQAKGLAQLAASPVFRSAPSAAHVGFAYATPALPTAVVYAELAIHPEVSSPATSGAPFGELVAAVYAGSRAQPDQLILASAPLKDVPLRGHVASTKAAVGQGSWFLVAKARHPLVGSVATATPWAILGAVLLAALLATGIVETLARRREYALGLVAIRTEELEQSLTELASAHEQLVRQERLAAIGQLASTIGHELRNPLGVISNAVYLLRNDFGPDPGDAAQRHLATAEREISAATVIVADLLEFARQRQPMVDDIDVTALVDEVLSILPPPTGITVTREHTGPVVVPADRDMLRQVLLNIIGNGYQAMPDGGMLTVTAVALDGAVQVRVSDTGVGMSAETRARLFEPFFTTKARGVGLGLAVSRRIVEAHSGEIVVDSEVARGTEFRILLPAIAIPRAAAASESSDRVAP